MGTLHEVSYIYDLFRVQISRSKIREKLHKYWRLLSNMRKFVLGSSEPREEKSQFATRLSISLVRMSSNSSKARLWASPL